MSYVTATAMIQKFGEREIVQLTDNEAPYQDVINYDKLNAAIEEANSEIDGWLQSRYSLPLQVIPPFLVNIACHLARYHACTQVITDNDPIKARYDDACKKLKSISKGEMGLGGSPAGESNPTESSSNNVILVVGRRDFGGRGW
ncbi:gp436 family protein [Acinetobacter beijerinckii]|uniref:gp436 family protein n=1 Tax=Acinetobacter beijerinckii TaxID=262668 RepID=UPI002405E2A1|nr:phage protein Gp36 family protein [Acinetobacter beijerinckii]